LLRTKRSACARMSHVPSDADSLIAYQQQLATSAPEPWIYFRPDHFDHRPLGCAFPVDSPVRVLNHDPAWSWQ
jgi:hypothetical protein